MVSKFFQHLVIMAFLFFGLWFSLSKITFIDKEDQVFIQEQEKKLGELLLKTIQKTEKEIKSEKIKEIFDSIRYRICLPSEVEFDSIHIHIIRSSEINAFALPNRHMVIYTGLIEYANNPEEVAGVMAHEIGHMEKNHVMKKLIKEIGISMLFTLTGGNGGSEILKQTAQILSSSAFDREQEREADDFAINMLAKADVDPENFGNIMFRLAKTHELPEEFEWISTHPDGKERAATILEKKKTLSIESTSILKTPWSDVKKLLSEETDNE